MILRVVPLAKLLPTAHFPFYEDLSRIPSPGDCLLQKSSGLFAYRKRPTYDLRVFKYGSFANAKLKIFIFAFEPQFLKVNIVEIESVITH